MKFYIILYLIKFILFFFFFFKKKKKEKLIKMLTGYINWMIPFFKIIINLNVNIYKVLYIYTHYYIRNV